MPDTRAALTMASDGGNTRFSISTDSMADVGALMVMVSWVQRKIGRYCRTRYLQATDAAYRQCRDAGTRLPQSDHARSLRPLTDDATLVSRHRSSVGLRWPSKRIAALLRLPIQIGMGCAMRLALRSAGRAPPTTSDPWRDTRLVFGHRAPARSSLAHYVAPKTGPIPVDPFKCPDRPARCSGAAALARIGRCVLPCQGKAANAQAVDRNAAAACRNDLGHDRASAGAELEAMGGEAELVIDALMPGAGSEDRQIVGHAGLDAGPGAQDACRAHDREQILNRPGTGGELLPVEEGAIFIAQGPAAVAAADQHRAIGPLLERELAPPRDHHRRDKGRQRLRDHQHRRDHRERHWLAPAGGDPVGPGTGGIDQARRGELAGIGQNAPERTVAQHLCGMHALADAGTESLRLALEGLRRAQRVGSAIRPRNHPPGAGPRNRGYQPAQFPGVDQFLMVKAAQSQHVDARAAVRQIGFGLGDQDLAVRTEAAIIVDEFADPVPERHGRVRERNLRDIAGELAHAAGIDARGMAAGMVFLQHDHRQPAHRAVQCARAAMDACADDDDVGMAALRVHGTTASMAASVCGRAASSASVTGLTGGRSR